VLDKAALGSIFTDLCTQVADDLQRKGYLGKTIGIKLRYADFKTATRDQTLDFYTADAAMLRKIAGQCLKRVPLTQRLRLLGVRVGSLVRTETHNNFEENRAVALAGVKPTATNTKASEWQLF